MFAVKMKIKILCVREKKVTFMDEIWCKNENLRRDAPENP